MMDWLNSIRVHTSPLVQPVQTLKVSADCPCSDGMRAEMNEYLLEMFGMRDVAYVMNVDLMGFSTGGQIMVMNPEMAAIINPIGDSK